MSENQARPTNPFTRFEVEDIEQSIPSRFEQMAARYPERVAVKTREEELTYSEQNAVANGIGRMICDKCGEGQSPVGLLVDQGTCGVAAVLGALKAGKFYVPLDPTNPRSRNAAILKDSGASLLLTDSKNMAAARELSQGTLGIVNCETIPPDIDDRNLDLSVSPDDIAWLMYTSGSTGRPKGVFNNHRNILHFIMNYTNSIHISSEDRLSLLRYISFVGATRDILAALLNGAALHAFDVRAEGVMPLTPWLIEENITVCFFGSPLFRAFLDTLTGEEGFSALRLIRLGSDSVRKQDVLRFQKYFSSRCILVNGLSSTETRTVCKYFIAKTTRIPTSTVPVGYPLDDMEIRLLDDDGNEVPSGEVGEIAVRSRYLSLGYWNQPDLTSAVFLDDPEGGDARIYRTGDLGRLSPDGLLEHLGRKDFQVKIRGMRVEIPEIENALLEMEEIKDAVVSLRNGRPGNERLVAYVAVADEKQTPPADMLKNSLKEKLPEYMIPSVFVMLDSLPVNTNGKVDRRALPEPDEARPGSGNGFAAPQTEIEKKLARIWEEVLGLERVGVQEDFFELGGQSLKVFQVVARVRSDIGLDLPLSAVFESPTISGIAETIHVMESS